jgi:hypothetical protein
MMVRYEMAESRGETAHGDAKADAYVKQYMEGLRAEPARRSAHTANRVLACCSSESVIAVEAFMNNAGIESR